MPEREFREAAAAQVIPSEAKAIGPEVAQGSTMILLATPSDRARECSAALQEATGETVVVAESLARATTLLRAQCYLVVVLDQYLLETGEQEAGSIFEHLGTALPVQVNLAISGMDRLVREVRSAVERRRHEELRARRAALGAISSELNGTVTALLLATELAMETRGLPPPAADKLQSVHDLVKKLRRQLESVAAEQEAKQAVGA
jgi:signal transduction histidine kinase